MIDHVQGGAGLRLRGHREDAQNDEPEMGDRRVRDQAHHILLSDRQDRAVQNADPSFTGYVASEGGQAQQISLALKELTSDERKIILDGCLINFYNS